MCAYNSVMSEKELMGNQNETGKEDGNAISVRLVSAPGKGPRTEGGRFYKRESAVGLQGGRETAV